MNQSSTKKYMILGAVLSVAVLLGAGCNMPVSLNFNGGENQAGEPAVEEPVETSAQNEAPAQQVPTQQQGQGNQDADGDGYAEPADNCPGVYNPTQQDTDGDGVGDACEVNESAKAACAGSCISSETECYGTGKTIVRDTVCTGANPVCCVTGQVAEPVPTCSGQCIMSETECYGTGKNIVHDTACTGINPVCCVTATPPTAPACPGQCIMSETECYGTGQSILRNGSCTGANPVCCVTE